MIQLSMISILYMNRISVVIKRNQIVDTVRTIFLLMIDNIVDQYLTTTESCKHLFGYACCISKEFAVRDFYQIVEKIACHFKLLYKQDFSLYHEALKEYNLNISTNKCSINTKITGRLVSIFERNDNETVVMSIQKLLQSILNKINIDMIKFLLNNFGLQIYHVLMKRLAKNDLHTPADLATEHLKCMKQKERFYFDQNEPV